MNIVDFSTMLNRVITYGVLITLLFISSGCQPQTATPAATPFPATGHVEVTASTPGNLNSPLITPTSQVKVIKVTFSPIATPSANAATLTGRVLSQKGRSPIADTSVHLASVEWNADHTDGIFALDVNTAPSADTDSAGAFVFANISSGDYVLVVGSIYAKPVIVSSPNGRPRVITIPTNVVTDIGEILILYP